MQPIAIHKTFDKSGLDGARKATLWIHDGKEAYKLQDKKRQTFIDSLTPGQIVRTTQVNATDADLMSLADRGVDIQYAHWHSLGFDKGMEPATIVEFYQKSPQSIFRTFVPRHDINDLRRVLAIRNGLLQCYGDALRRFKQVGRSMNLTTDEQLRSDPLIQQGIDGIKSIKGLVLEEDKTTMDEQVAKLAKEIPECILFNKIAHFKTSWILAASVVATSGGFDRFDDVASLWHYYGLHVVEGIAPKRKAGVPMDWSPFGRKTAYMIGDVIIKATDHGGKREGNPWREKYDEYRAIERDGHEKKCPCKTPDGHSTARARRKVVKSIFKRFFVAVKGDSFVEGHNPLEA